MFTGFAIGEFKMELDQWEKSVSSITRKYNHFDLWTSYNSVRHYILDRSKIQKHGFYPLIHFEMPKPKWIKYKGKAKVNTEKKRDIFSLSPLLCVCFRVLQSLLYFLGTKVSQV